MTRPLDHLVWGCADLDQGIDQLEALTGVRPAHGGSHKGVGTRNALMSLGRNVYLELMAPDPARTVDGGLGARLRDLGQSGLIAWAARSGDLQAFAAAPRREPLSPVGPLRMRRARPDGRTLTWELLFLGETSLGYPFFIDWLDCPHPAGEAPSGCELRSFEVLTPNIGKMVSAFAGLHLEAPLRKSPQPGLQAVVDTPKGQVRLSSIQPLAINLP